MADNETNLKMIATLQNQQFIAGMKQLRAQLKDASKEAESTQSALKNMVQQAAMFAGISLGAAGVKQFASQVINVRKQMQSLQVSFETLLGSREKANKMFGELKQFAATTPLMLKDLADGAQTMLGFNIEAEKVVPTLKAIGDISMGDSEKFKSLTLAFSQMSATGKLMGQDLLQMINAGFNPLTEISRKTGKSIATLKDEMSKGAISADMVADAFRSATSEGGKFNGMLEKQGQTLAGSMNQLQGAIDDMFNSIGEQTEGVIAKAVSSIESLVKNYEKVGKVLVSLIATYGAYRAAVLANVAIDAVKSFGLKDGITYLGWLIKETKAATAAQKAFNAVAKANPYVLLASVLVAAGSAIWALSDGLSKAEKIQKQLKEQTEGSASEMERERTEARSLIGVLQDETATVRDKEDAYEQLTDIVPQLTENLSQEKLQVLNLKDAYELLDKAQRQKRISQLKAENQNVKSLLKEARSAASDSRIDVADMSSESQAYFNTRGLGSLNKEERVKYLEKAARGIRKELKTLQNPVSKTNEPEKIYSEEAKRLMDDWEKAKKTYEALLKDKKATDKQVKEARIAVDTADTAYETLTGTKASAKVKKDKEQAKKTKEQAKKLEKAQQDADFEARQAILNEEPEGSAKAVKQLELDFEKKKAEIEREYKEQIELAEEFTDKKAKAEMKANAEALKEVRTILAEQERDKGKTDIAKGEAKAMREYLIAWGTMQEKRASITEEYNERIRKATTEGEKKALQEELDAALSNLDLSEFQDKINWGVVFGDLDNYTKSQLKTLKSQLKEFKKSDQYTKATVENKKVVDDALNSITEAIQTKGGIFGGLAQALTDLSDAETELSEATTALDNATTDKEREAAQKRKNQAQGEVDQNTARVRSQAEKTRDSIAGLASQIAALGNASEMTLSDLGSLANNVISMFAEKAGGWVEAIFVLFDMIARNGLDGLIKNVGKLLGQALGGLFGEDIDESTHYYEDQKKLHDNYIKLIEETISKQEELMKRQTGLEAVKTSEEIQKEYGDIADYKRKDIKNFLNSGASKGFLGIGSSASEGRKLAEKFKTSILEASITGDTSASDRGNRLKDILGVDSLGGRMEALADATVEQIELMKKDQDIWAHLPDAVQEYYQAILDANKAIEENNKALNETLTQTTFDSVRDKFKDNLKSMKTSAQDWANDFEDMMREAVVNGIMTKNFDKAIEAWYDDFSAKLKDDDGLTAKEKEELETAYNKIVQESTEMIGNAYETIGIKDTYGEASATINAAMGITEDTANELVGRMTAIQIGQQLQSETALAISQAVTGMSVAMVSQDSHLSTLVDLAAVRNSMIGDIYERLGKMQTSMEASLSSIANNTSKL